jgi:hypothetical protein
VGGVAAAGGLVAARLTERDRELLARLDEHEPLTTSELRLLFFTGESRCRRRLRALAAEGLLVRVFPARPRRGGSEEALWFLSAEGRRLLAAPARRGPGLSIPDLEHRRAVARFFCRLVEHSLGRGGEGLWTWRGERSCERALGGAGRPDGYGRYLLPHGEITFYLELDRGTESRTRLRAKLEAYLKALAANPDARFGNVLLHVPSRRRLRGLADPVLQGPPWIWASTDGERYILLPGGEQRPFDELPAWPRDPSRRVEDCLGWRWRRGGDRT